MNLKQKDRTVERVILTNYILNKEYVEQVDGYFRESYLEAAGPKTILRWCRDFYKEFNDVPKAYIVDVFIENEAHIEETEADYIRKLLDSLSGEWERRSSDYNLQYIVDKTREFCETQHLQEVHNNLSDYLSQGRIKEAAECIKEFQPVSTAIESGTNPVDDEEGWEAAFNDEQNELLFTLPGVWGEFMDEQLYRESFIGFLAPDKSGKSFLLQEIAMQALRAGRNVAIFEAGDMTKNQRYQRLAQCLSGLPKRRRRPGKELEQTITVQYPIDFEGNTEPRELQNLTKALAKEAVQKWVQRRKRNGGQLRMQFYLNSTLTFKEMERQLGVWEKEDGFIPDVIIDDYLDLHAPENPRLEFRHQESQKWKLARQFSQRYHCCFITVTQADADSYDKEHLSKKNFSETKSKYHEVTAMYAINRTKEDKILNQIRLQSLTQRDGEELREIKILQCLEIGRPYIKSDWCKPINKSIDKVKQLGKSDFTTIELAKIRIKNTTLSNTAIAKEVGLTVQRIGQIKKEMKENGELDG